jgi:hypothetical protein
MAATVRPIETVYQGYRFRSRLEARWAVFFDALGVAWDYELQGFDLGGVRYLPDFWLSTVRMWAEVKPVPFTPEEVRKCELLADASERPVLKLVGVPTFRSYWAVEPSEAGERWELDYLLDDQYLESEERFYNSPCLGNEADASEEFDQSPRTRAAYGAARAARFEYGEQGAAGWGPVVRGADGLLRQQFTPPGRRPR